MCESWEYNINLDEFEVVDDNKINNKTNRQKPKSIIDFFTKEIGVSIKETTEICNNLMTKQPKKVVDKIEDEEKSQELIYPYIDKNLEQNKEILNEKNKRKKRKNWCDISSIYNKIWTKYNFSKWKIYSLVYSRNLKRGINRKIHKGRNWVYLLSCSLILKNKCSFHLNDLNTNPINNYINRIQINTISPKI